MEAHDGEDYMLYALLNGGAPYLIRDGAYPNTDGAFEDEAIGKRDMTKDEKLREAVKRCDIVSKLHERIAKCEMVRHEFVDGDINIQKTIFSDGTEVTVDFTKQSYKIVH